MKKSISIILMLSLMLLIFSACSGTTKDKNKTANNLMEEANKKVDSNAASHKFAIYLVKDVPNYLALDSKNIEKFDLQPEPVITEQDIASYKWNDTNTKSDSQYKKNSSFTLIDGASVWGKIKGRDVYPFVVTVDNVRTYVGEFVFPTTSVATGKDIYVYSPMPTSEQEKNIVQLFDRSDKDLIHDKRIYNVFKNLGILNE